MLLCIVSIYLSHESSQISGCCTQAHIQNVFKAILSLTTMVVVVVVVVVMMYALLWHQKFRKIKLIIISRSFLSWSLTFVGQLAVIDWLAACSFDCLRTVRLAC